MSLITCFGLGIMGEPIAIRLLEAGHTVTIWDGRSKDAVGRLKTFGCHVAGTPREAASGAEAIITCLPNGSSVHEVLFEGSHPAVEDAAGALILDLSTIGPESAAELGDRAENVGLRYVDAPVSGGPSAAAKGLLTVMAGGSTEDLTQAEALCAAFAKEFQIMGARGSGQATKLCNNLLVAQIMMANAQALALGESYGLPPEVLMPVLSKSSGSNWQLDNILSKTVLKDDYTPLFSVSHMAKDTLLILEAAAASGIPMPSFEHVSQAYVDSKNEYYADADFSIIYKRLIDQYVR